MTEFYAESGYELNKLQATRAFETLLNDSRLGFIWIIQDNGIDAGYLVVTLKFAMEYSGTSACLDDLFVLPAYRNRGLSTAALQELRVYCQNNHIHAMTVEVARDNAAAQKVYFRTGLLELENRVLLGLALANPSHVV
jgi:GNAT superfamily N-acetyltransferase